MDLKNTLLSVILLILGSSASAQYNIHTRQPETPHQPVTRTLFNFDQDFWKYTNKTSSLSSSLLKAPNIDVPDDLILYNKTFFHANHFAELKILKNDSLIHKIPLHFFYHFDIIDKNEYVNNYLKGVKEAVNAKGTGSIGLAVGDYNQNFLRLLGHGERFGTLNNLVGATLDAKLFGQGADGFWNRISNDKSTDVWASDSLGISKSFTRKSDINTIEDFGFSFLASFLSNNLKFKVDYESVKKDFLFDHTVEVWVPNAYFVVPRTGEKSIEKTSLVGLEGRFLTANSNALGANASLLLFQNEVQGFERESIEILSDSTYRDVYVNTEKNVYRAIAMGLGLNHHDKGGRFFLNQDFESKEKTVDLILHDASYYGNTLTALFVEYYGATDLFVTGVNVVKNPGVGMLEMLIETEYYEFTESIKNQHRFLDPISRFEYQRFKLERAKPYSHLNNNSLAVSFSVGTNNPNDYFEIAPAEELVEFGLSAYFRRKIFMGGFSVNYSQEGDFVYGVANVQLAMKYRRGFLGVGSKSIYETFEDLLDINPEGETEIEELRTTTLTFELGLYF